MIEQSAREQKQAANVAKLKERERQIKQLARRAEQLRTLQCTTNLPAYARSMLGAKLDTWDSHPWLLGTRQGVIDLRTGTLRTGQPDDRLRLIIPTEWKGLDEPAPRFQHFLREIFGNREEAEREELIAFLQRALGYGITGNVHEHIFLMFYGAEEGNGKDMLLHVLEYVLGKAVGAISGDTLIASGRNSASGTARPHLCNLQGKRIAWISKNSHESRFTVDQIKQLTDGGEIVARQVYAKEYTFIPSHLLILLTNHRPETDAADSVFWERACPLVFNTRFVDKSEHPQEQPHDLRLRAALEAEASGILAWLVSGALAWTRLGLAIPASVRNARQEYRRSESSVQDFVKQCCLLEAEASTPANQLYKRYKRWSSTNSLTPISVKQFTREMKLVAHVTLQRSQQRNVYQGIRLKQEAETVQ